MHVVTTDQTASYAKKKPSVGFQHPTPGKAALTAGMDVRLIGAHGGNRLEKPPHFARWMEGIASSEHGGEFTAPELVEEQQEDRPASPAARIVKANHRLTNC
ncbi:hypothetical protein MRQ47_004438 [Salmonella enterica]|nr:hypothetical protein [Salmonella enterica]